MLFSILLELLSPWRFSDDFRGNRRCSRILESVETNGNIGTKLAKAGILSKESNFKPLMIKFQMSDLTMVEWLNFLQRKKSLYDTQKSDEHLMKILVYWLVSKWWDHYSLMSKPIFGQCSRFIPPWKHQKTFGFLVLSGGMRCWNWPEMRAAIFLIFFKFYNSYT